mmetsp:Transcript_7166/g.18136  ORF Transcript_7166/g.18136 Transcript_7166/m.18136 type:complete len:218 (-) Transcript_7166:114-767(-)
MAGARDDWRAGWPSSKVLARELEHVLVRVRSGHRRDPELCIEGWLYSLCPETGFLIVISPPLELQLTAASAASELSKSSPSILRGALLDPSGLGPIGLFSHAVLDMQLVSSEERVPCPVRYCDVTSEMYPTSASIPSSSSSPALLDPARTSKRLAKLESYLRECNLPFEVSSESGVVFVASLAYVHPPYTEEQCSSANPAALQHVRELLRKLDANVR